jgi:hypothetical protein
VIVLPKPVGKQVPLFSATGVVPGSLWRVVFKLMNAEIERDTQLYMVLITARETGQAILDIADHNDRLRLLFMSLYGISIKEYINKCLSEKKSNPDMHPAFAEYECWYSLLLRVYLILKQPSQKQLMHEEREQDMLEAEEISEE